MIRPANLLLFSHKIDLNFEIHDPYYTLSHDFVKSPSCLHCFDYLYSSSTIFKSKASDILLLRYSQKMFVCVCVILLAMCLECLDQFLTKFCTKSFERKIFAKFNIGQYLLNRLKITVMLNIQRTICLEKLIIF